MYKSNQKELKREILVNAYNPSSDIHVCVHTYF